MTQCKMYIEQLFTTKPFEYVLFGRTLDTFENTHQIYFTPGHLFIYRKENCNLKSYDVIPHDVQKVDNRFIDVEVKSPLLAIGFRKMNRHLIIITSNNYIQVWTFSKNAYSWSFDSKTKLVNENWQLTSCVFNPTYDTIYWCQEWKTSETGTNCALYYQRLARSGKTPLDDEPTQILFNCPKCDIYCIHESVYIFPSQPSPPNMYLQWLPTSLIMEVHILGVKDFYREQKFGKTIDFKSLAMKVVSIWSRKPLHSISRVLHSKDNIYIIDYTKHIIRIDKDGETVLCQLSADLRTESHVCVKGRMLYTCEQKTICKFSLESGILLEKAEIGDDIMGCYITEPPIQYIIVWTTNRLYQLIDESQVSGCASRSPYSNYSTILAIEEMYQYYQKRVLSDDKPSIETLLNNKITESPGILIALLQEASNCGLKMSTEIISESIRKVIPAIESKEATSRLNQELGPLLKEYCQLEVDKGTIFSSKHNDNTSNEHLTSEVIEVLSSGNSISVIEKCTRLHILGDRYGEALANTILNVLEFEVVNSRGLSDDVPSLHYWKYIMTPSKTAPGQLPMYETVWYLLYVYSPQNLVHFWRICCSVLEDHVASPSFVHSKDLNLAKIALLASPPTEVSRDRKTAIKVMSQMHVNCGDTGGYVNALKLFIQADLWEESIELLKSCHSTASTSSYTVLYNLLVKAIIESKMYTLYAPRLVEIVPHGMNASETLEIVRKGLDQGSTAIPGHCASVFSKENDIPISTIKNYVTQKFSTDINLDNEH